ncbi:MAG: hypothetical protein R3321_10100, partial [Nitrososphaeraceae archaeon]|nr:hypothetical protein [Nitrososphaeraceae archaeon]
GGTGAKQFRKKLKMLAGEIANQLNISLRKNRKGGLKLALGKTDIPPKQRGLKIGKAFATNDIARTIGLRRGHGIRDLPPRQRGLRRNLIIANLPPSERGRMLGAVLRSNFSVSNALELPANV